MTSTSTRRELTRGQSIVLILAAVPMIGVGIAGGIGTYSNVVSEFGRAATAVGVVASGEGVTLVLALVMLILTMLGQPSPIPVRAGLWATPLAAAVMGVAVADTPTERIVYGITPMAMCGAAEGLGLLARRVVIYRTGVDAEADRRNAETVQQLAYHQALAARHPDEGVRADAERRSWKLVGRVGVGDPRLAEGLVEVQRERLRQGADAALSGMLAIEAAPSVVQPTTPARPVTATEALRREFAGMDPVEAIRLAHDARPDAPPAELASLLVSYGVVVDAVQVALVLGTRPAEHTVDRAPQQDATGVAPQVGGGRPALTKSEAIRDVAQLLGPDAPAADIAAAVAERHRLDVEPNFVRAVLSRSKKPAGVEQQAPARDEMREGYN